MVSPKVAGTLKKMQIGPQSPVMDNSQFSKNLKMPSVENDYVGKPNGEAAVGVDPPNILKSVEQFKMDSYYNNQEDDNIQQASYPVGKPQSPQSNQNIRLNSR